MRYLQYCDIWHDAMYRAITDYLTLLKWHQKLTPAGPDWSVKFGQPATTSWDIHDHDIK